MAINFATGGVQRHPAFSGKVVCTLRVSGWVTTSSGWQAIADLDGGDITIQRAQSEIIVLCHLSTEVDGSGASHGLARLQRSNDNGSSWHSVAHFNITGANDNDIGDGFHYRIDHNQAAGTTYRFRVQYRKGNTSGNHTIADNGPGEATRASLIYWEQHTD